MRHFAAWLAIALAAAAAVVSPGATAAPATGAAGATIVTVAGNGIDGHDGDGGQATVAAIDHPRGVAVLADGSLIFAEPFLNTVRRVSVNGIITTVVGTGERGYSGDGGPAVLAKLDLVHGVAALPDGSFVLADMGNDRIRRVTPDGTISTVVGTGVRGFGGDGGQATAAQIALPRGIASLPNGELLIPDTINHRVRRVTTDGIISTVAGSGARGFAGDGGPAVAATLNRPFGVAPMPGGGFLIADVDNHRVRRVWPDGTIATVAGTGTPAFSGDGGPATAADLSQPHAVAALPGGGFLIADTANHRVRRVLPDGTITTIAGTGSGGFSGDGGPPTAAQLYLPKALAVLPDASGFYLGDSGNNRIRLVRVDLRPALALRVTVRTMRVRKGRSAVLRYTLSESASVRLLADRRGRLALRLDAKGKQGLNRLPFGRGLQPGSYALTIRASTPDGRSTRASATLTIVR